MQNQFNSVNTRNGLPLCRILFLVIITMNFNPLEAQKVLNPVNTTMDELEGLLKSSKNKFNKLIVQSETGVTMELTGEYEGFTEKKYTLKMEVLNKLKLPLKEIVPVVQELNPRAKTVDFSFQFKPLATQTYQANSVESAFIKITVIEEGKTELEKLLAENRSFLFECKKAWAVKTIANNNTVVEIKLIPLPTAAAIKPSNQ